MNYDILKDISMYKKLTESMYNENSKICVNNSYDGFFQYVSAMSYDFLELFITTFIITSMKTIRMEEINVSHGERSTQS